MPISDLKRLLIIPAILVATALPLTGCFPTVTGPATGSSRGGSDDEVVEEDDAEEAPAGKGCPAGFEEKIAASGAEGSVTVIAAGDFVVPEVGSDILSSACIFETTSEVDGSDVSAQAAYLSGDSTVIDEISANLEASGFEKFADTDGFYTNEASGISIIIVDGGELPAGTDDLGFDASKGLIALVVIQS